MITKAKICLGLVLLVGCVQRNIYVGAKSEDIKFCRMESRMVPPMHQNAVYNDCMVSLGY
jgi:hypothetical protein